MKKLNKAQSGVNVPNKTTTKREAAADLIKRDQKVEQYLKEKEKNSYSNERANKVVGKKPMKAGGMIKRADGSYSKRGLWDNIRANKGSGKKPTAQMLKQEKKIKAQTKKK